MDFDTWLCVVTVSSPILLCLIVAGLGIILYNRSLPGTPNETTDNDAKFAGVLLLILGVVGVPFACWWTVLAVSFQPC